MVVSRALKLHADTSCALSGIQVEVERLRTRQIEIRWIALGPVRHIVIPWPTKPARAGELWNHTCFEAFVRAEGEEDYIEFNIAPRGNWNAYIFDGYRSGMKVAKQASASQIAFDWRDEPLSEERRSGLQEAGYDTFDRFPTPFFYVSALIDLERVHRLPSDLPWRLGLSAVIEENNGRKSYWALEHPAGKPDFHDPDCFALELPAPRRP
jgi:hypothetical protein